MKETPVHTLNRQTEKTEDVQSHLNLSHTIMEAFGGGLETVPIQLCDHGNQEHPPYVWP